MEWNLVDQYGLAVRLSVMPCVAPLAKVTTKVVVYFSPARNGAVPSIVNVLLFVELGDIVPTNGCGMVLNGVGVVLVATPAPLLIEVMLTLEIATVPMFCTVTVSVALLPEPGIRA